MFDREALYERLGEMLQLEEDWDGFGTKPISPSVYKIAKDIIANADESLVYNIQVFVGVSVEGSVFMDIDQAARHIEMTITPEGTIHFDEIIAGLDVGSGIFTFSKVKLLQILNG